LQHLLVAMLKDEALEVDDVQLGGTTGGNVRLESVGVLLLVFGEATAVVVVVSTATRLGSTLAAVSRHEGTVGVGDTTAKGGAMEAAVVPSVNVPLDGTVGGVGEETATELSLVGEEDLVHETEFLRGTVGEDVAIHRVGHEGGMDQRRVAATDLLRVGEGHGQGGKGEEEFGKHHGRRFCCFAELLDEVRDLRFVRTKGRNGRNGVATQPRLVGEAKVCFNPQSL